MRQFVGILKTNLAWFATLFNYAVIAGILIILGNHAALAQQQEVKIAIQHIRGEQVMLNKWSPMVEYLNRKLPDYHFTLVPVALSEVNKVVEGGVVDFILTNTSKYVEQEIKYGAAAIATLRQRHDGKNVSQFGSILFARADRDDIATIDDLHGKSFMGVTTLAFGGFQMAWYELKQHGIDPYDDFSALHFSGFPQDNVVIAVRDGLVDVGTVRTGILEAMAAEGSIRLDEFRIINAQDLPEFPQRLSTQLYPEWPFAKLPHTDDQLAQQVAITLLSMSPDSSAAIAAGSAGWTTPLDYQPVHELMQKLRIGPYEKLGEVSLHDVFEQYQYLIIIFVLVATALLFISIYVTRLNHRLRTSEVALANTESEWIQAMDSIEDIMYLVDLDDRLVRANQAFYKIKKLSPKQAVGRDIASLIHLREEDEPCPVCRARLSRQDAFFNKEADDPSNPIGKPVEIMVKVIRDQVGEPIGILQSIRDLSRMRMVQEELERFKTTLDRTLDCIFMFHHDSLRFFYVNQGAVDQIGYSYDELMTMTPFDIKPNIDEAAFRQMLVPLINREQESLTFETIHRHKHGTDIAVEIFLQYIAPQGELARFVAIVRDITERKIAEQKIKTSERDLSTILNNMQDTFFRTDIDGKLVRISPSVEKLLGYRPEELLHTRLADLYKEPGGREKFLVILNGNDGKVTNYQVVLKRKDGSEVWVSTNAQFYYDEQGQIAGVEGTTRDISKLKAAEEELFQQKEWGQVTLQSIADGVITTNIEGRIQYLNPMAEQLIGMSRNDACGKALADVFTLVDEASGLPLENLMKDCLNNQAYNIGEEHGILTRVDGSEFSVRLTAAPMRDSRGQATGCVLALHDITELTRMANQLSYQASHDPLTGLINRREFERRLEHALEGACTMGHSHVLCYMDLDQFKIVNDTCGHVAGDELLKQVTSILDSHIRGSDTLARLGGDEFGLLLEGCPLNRAEEIAETLRRAIMEFRFAWQERVFDIGVSIGLVPVTSETGNITELLSAADSACYVAKDLGRNRFHVYHVDDHALAHRHGEMEWAQRIKVALDDNQLSLYCQRIFPLQGEEQVCEHYEILVRMLDKQGELILPGTFIPAAERYHLMPDIDRWVVKQSFEALRNITQINGREVIFAINLSGQSLGDDQFIEFIFTQLQLADLPARNLCFEITETSAISNLSRAKQFIRKLKSMGCRFALDDFGSGLSSYAYLKNLPVDYLKIDGGFVRDMLDDEIDHAMVESINHIGDIVGVETIAEFVGDEATKLRLKEIGVNYGQGYGLEMPQPLEAIFSELSV